MSELRFKANEKQKKALRILDDHETRSVGYGGGAGGGKSFLGVFWCWFMCQMHPGVRYFFGRNELKNLKRTTVVSYWEFIDKYDIPQQQSGRFRDKDSKITFENGSEILLIELKYKPSDPLSKDLGSLLLTGGFVDESNEVDIRVLQILYTRVGRWMNDVYDIFPKILETFNPSKDHVYHRFYKPHKKGNMNPGVAFIRALVTDWLVHPEYFRKHLKVHPDEQKTWYAMYIMNLLAASLTTQERLLWGNFEYDDDPSALCDYDSITDTFTNSHVGQTGKRYISADVALEGSDKLVIGVWDGWVLIHVVVMAKSRSDEVIAVIEGLKIRFKVSNSRIVYDSDGVGAYVGGFVKGAQSFVNGSRPVEVKGEKENYENLKTQCYYRLAKRINDKELWLKALEDTEHQQLAIEEMEQIKSRDADKDGKLKMIQKEKVKALLGRSPDYADMIMMREFFELNKPKKRSKTRSAVI